MAKSKQPFKDDSGPQVLLAEGINDCHVISALCAKYQLPKNFKLFDCGSDDKLTKKLSALIKSNGVDKKQTLGAVIDADDNLTGRWQSISDKLQKSGYTLPTEPSPNGTIITPDDPDLPVIGIWLMPDNNTNGMLEDFCHRLIEPENLIVAEQSVAHAKTQNATTFKEAHHAKAVIHTYLAWQDEPGLPLGAAITAKALDGDKPLAQSFVQFLEDLFVAQ